MSSSLFRSLIRRRQSALAANMSHPRLIGSSNNQGRLMTRLGFTPAKVFRDWLAKKLRDIQVQGHEGGLTKVTSDIQVQGHEDGLTKKNSDTQVNVVATFLFEGLQASEIKILIDLVQERLDIAGANKALFNQFISLPPFPEEVRMRCHSEATVKGFGESESVTLRHCAEKFTTTALDLDLETKKNKKINLVQDCYSKERKFDTLALGGPHHVGCYSEATLKGSDEPELETLL